LGVFKPGAVHPVTPAPIKALPCLCFFPPMAEKSKPAALRVVGDSNIITFSRGTHKFYFLVKLSFRNKYKSCDHEACIEPEYWKRLQ
jgi:hypothetical protein